MKRIGYINIYQKNLDFSNFIAAFGVLLNKVRVISEIVDGEYIQYLAESEYFDLFEKTNDVEDIPHYDVKFVTTNGEIEVYFQMREDYWTFPKMRQVGASMLMGKSFVSVQPMSSPSGSTQFYLNYQIKTNNNAIPNKAITQPSNYQTNRSGRKNVWEHSYPRHGQRKTYDR
jgi:hypothetical protein